MSEVDFASEAAKVLQELSERAVMILATSANDLVTARSMSTVVHAGKIYFQTDNLMEKYRQIQVNGNVALCVGNLQIQGTARDVGPWDDNQEVLVEYKKKHSSSYEAYGTHPSQAVIEITLKNLKKWEYEAGVPFISTIDFESKVATRAAYRVDESRP